MVCPIRISQRDATHITIFSAKKDEKAIADLQVQKEKVAKAEEELETLRKAPVRVLGLAEAPPLTTTLAAYKTARGESWLFDEGQSQV